MIRHVHKYSESWRDLSWKRFRKILLKLQIRVYKAIRAGDKRRARKLQKLILKSYSARMLAIRQVTQLNTGKKTAGVDGIRNLSPKQRFELELTLRENTFKWQHSKLREIPIPKKDGTRRILKVPTIKDRAWQCLIKYAVEPAHEAIFHPRSYGFRPGRCQWDAQKFLHQNLNSHSRGYEKRVLELDIEKCFDRIEHNALMRRVIAPQSIKLGIWKSLKAGINPEFPNQGTPQGGVFSPLLANIALDGIEDIHKSVRYADDMVFILKPKDDANKILIKIEEFLTQRGLKVKASKTKLVSSTDGFDFLGWHFYVQNNGKFRCVPSKENYKTFRKKVKSVVNNSNYGAKEKAKKLAPIVRGWRNYHQYCKLDGNKFSLSALRKRTSHVFGKEKKLNRHQVKSLVNKAYPKFSYSESKYVNVKGDKSLYDGDVAYWSKRNSKLYNNITAITLRLQNHKCGHCKLNFLEDETVELHHIDGNHNNWKLDNLLAVHKSCHDYIHASKSHG